MLEPDNIDNPKKHDEQVAILYQKVFCSEQGEEVLKDLISKYCHYGTFNKDPNQMYFNEGQRAVIRDILSLVDIDIQRARELNKDILNSF